MPKNSSMAITPAAMFLWPNEPRQLPARPGSCGSVARWIDRCGTSRMPTKQVASSTSAAMLNQRIISCCDFASSGSDAATVTTQTVRLKRRIEVLGSNDSTMVTSSQPVNSTKAGESSVLRPVAFSRMASTNVSAAKPPNVT